LATFYNVSMDDISNEVRKLKSYITDNLDLKKKKKTLTSSYKHWEIVILEVENLGFFQS
jgi:hypothetical protein